MDIAALSSTADTAATRSQSRLAEDFDNFLTLLTTQLQHQDPLEPTDSNEFTRQLVAFAGVEQQIQTNQSLDRLAKLTALNQTNTAVGYLGREAVIASDRGIHSGSGVAFEIDLAGGADSTKLQILDAGGRVIAEHAGPTAAGRHSFRWDGTDALGREQPQGTYALRVVARDAEAAPVAASVFVRGAVTQIETQGLEPLLTVAGIPVRLDEILAVRAPQS